MGDGFDDVVHICPCLYRMMEVDGKRVRRWSGYKSHLVPMESLCTRVSDRFLSKDVGLVGCFGMNPSQIHR